MDPTEVTLSASITCAFLFGVYKHQRPVGAKRLLFSKGSRRESEKTIGATATPNHLPRPTLIKIHNTGTP